MFKIGDEVRVVTVQEEDEEYRVGEELTVSGDNGRSVVFFTAKSAGLFFSQVELIRGNKSCDEEIFRLLMIKQFDEFCHASECVDCGNCQYLNSGDCAISYALDNYDRVREEAMKIQPPFRDRVENDDTYYLLDGNMRVSEDVYYGTYLDGSRREIGNFFETEEEAEKARERVLKALAGDE